MFYSGMTQDGKVILTPEFAASLAQAGLPPPACIEVAHPRGYALDSADRGHQPDEDGALNLALNLAYARLLHGDNADSGANLDETFAGVAPTVQQFRGTRASDSWPWNLRRIHIGRSSKRSETVHRIQTGAGLGSQRR